MVAPSPDLAPSPARVRSTTTTEFSVAGWDAVQLAIWEALHGIVDRPPASVVPMGSPRS
jgi:hypothetical protein